MKTRFIFAAAALIGLYANSPSSFAALDKPMGMTVDGNGNLYVANFGSNLTPGGGGVTIYNPSYQEIKSFGYGYNNPTGVALNSSGQVYVSDTMSRSIKLYDPGTNYSEVPPRAVTNGVKYPVGVAVDGFDNVWVVNLDYKLGPGNGTVPVSTVNMYGFDGALLNTGYPPSVTNAIATKGAFVGLAEDQGLESLRTLEVLTNDVQHVHLSINSQVTAVGFDNFGVEYVGTADRQLFKCYASSGYCVALRTIDYVPSGIAIDPVRGRLYVSSMERSTVDVFKTDDTATFLTTFH